MDAAVLWKAEELRGSHFPDTFHSRREIEDGIRGDMGGGEEVGG